MSSWAACFGKGEGNTLNVPRRLTSVSAAPAPPDAPPPLATEPGPPPDGTRADSFGAAGAGQAEKPPPPPVQNQMGLLPPHAGRQRTGCSATPPLCRRTALQASLEHGRSLYAAGRPEDAICFYMQQLEALDGAEGPATGAVGQLVHLLALSGAFGLTLAERLDARQHPVQIDQLLKQSCQVYATALWARAAVLLRGQPTRWPASLLEGFLQAAVQMSQAMSQVMDSEMVGTGAEPMLLQPCWIQRDQFDQALHDCRTAGWAALH